MANKSYPEVRKFLLGPRGTVVKVTVLHNGSGQKETVSITRDAVPLPSIPQAYMVSLERRLCGHDWWLQPDH